MLRLSAFLFSGFFAFIQIADAARASQGLSSSGYYVLENGAISFTSGNPNTARTKHWQIWLYNQGEPVGDRSKAWGVIDERTLEGALASLKRSQQFERLFSKFFRTPYPDRTGTYTNPFGPIASFDHTPLVPADFFSRVAKLNSRLARAMAQLSQYEQYREEAKAGQALYQANPPKTPTSEYLRLLKTSIDDSSQLGHALWRLDGDRIDVIDRALSDLEKDLANAESRESSKITSLATSGTWTRQRLPLWQIKKEGDPETILSWEDQTVDFKGDDIVKTSVETVVDGPLGRAEPVTTVERVSKSAIDHLFAYCIDNSGLTHSDHDNLYQLKPITFSALATATKGKGELDELKFQDSESLRQAVQALHSFTGAAVESLHCDDIPSVGKLRRAEFSSSTGAGANARPANQQDVQKEPSAIAHPSRALHNVLAFIKQNPAAFAKPGAVAQRSGIVQSVPTYGDRQLPLHFLSTQPPAYKSAEADTVVSTISSSANSSPAVRLTGCTLITFLIQTDPDPTSRQPHTLIADLSQVDPSQGWTVFPSQESFGNIYVETFFKPGGVHVDGNRGRWIGFFVKPQDYQKSLEAWRKLLVGCNSPVRKLGIDPAPTPIPYRSY